MVAQSAHPLLRGVLVDMLYGDVGMYCMACTSCNAPRAQGCILCILWYAGGAVVPLVAIGCQLLRWLVDLPTHPPSLRGNHAYGHRVLPVSPVVSPW